MNVIAEVKMSKVKSLESFAQSLIKSSDVNIEEIGEELLYFVNEWKKEIGYQDRPNELDDAGLLKIPNIKIEDDSNEHY